MAWGDRRTSGSEEGFVPRLAIDPSGRPPTHEAAITGAGHAGRRAPPPYRTLTATSTDMPGTSR
jgi:hypothetical protein